MAFTALETTEIAVDRPITNDLMTKVKDNFDYLYSQTGAVEVSLPNPSFDIDTDANGVPDNWSLSLYAAGAGAASTADSHHGERSFIFTRTSGAGNGGGELLSDYMSITTGVTYYTQWAHKQSAANVRSKVRMQFYTASKTTLADSTIYDSTINPTTWMEIRRSYSAPDTARFCKILLIGGTTDKDIAGTIAFDDIQAGRSIYELDSTRSDALDITWAKATVARTRTTSGGSTYTKVKSTKPIYRSGKCVITFAAQATGGGSTGTAKVRINSSDATTDIFSVNSSLKTFIAMSSVFGGVTLNSGDCVEVWVANTSAGCVVTVSDLRVLSDDPNIVRDLDGY